MLDTVVNNVLWLAFVSPLEDVGELCLVSDASLSELLVALPRLQRAVYPSRACSPRKTKPYQRQEWYTVPCYPLINAMIFS